MQAACKVLTQDLAETVCVSSILHLPNSSCFSTWNPEPPNVSGKNWETAEGSSCRFYFGTMWSAALCRRKLHSINSNLLLPFCNAAWALSICVVKPVCLACYPSGAGRCHPLYFSDHKYFSRVPEEQPFYRYFTNISYFYFIQTPHPCSISIYNSPKPSRARYKAETTAFFFWRFLSQLNTINSPITSKLIIQIILNVLVKI